MPPQYEYDPWEGTHWEGKSKVEVIREVAGGLFTDEIAADVELSTAGYVGRFNAITCAFFYLCDSTSETLQKKNLDQ